MSNEGMLATCLAFVLYILSVGTVLNLYSTSRNNHSLIKILLHCFSLTAVYFFAGLYVVNRANSGPPEVTVIEPKIPWEIKDPEKVYKIYDGNITNNRYSSVVAEIINSAVDTMYVKDLNISQLDSLVEEGLNKQNIPIEIRNLSVSKQ